MGADEDMMARARRNGGGIAYYVAVVLAGVALAWVIAQVLTLSERADRSREDRDVLIEDVRVLRDQIEDMGQIPEAPEPEERITEDPPPPVSDERLDAAVERFCGLPGCRGPRGFPGADSTVPGPRGRPGEDSTVPGPVGPPGADSTVPGPPGEPGADSTVAGPPGPAGEDGADSTVPGPAGSDGQDGADGQDGRGLTGTPEILLRDDGECVLRFHYTAEPLTTDTPLPNRFCRPDLLE